MAAPSYRIVQVAGMIPERPKSNEGGSWGTGCLEVSIFQLCNLASFNKSLTTQTLRFRKIGLLFSKKIRLVEGWH